MDAGDTNDSLRNEIEKSYILHWNYRNMSECPDELDRYGRHLEELYFKGNCIEQLVRYLLLIPEN